MDTRTKSCLLLSTLMACAFSAQPAVAQSGNLSDLGTSMPRSFGRALSDFEMSDLRGGYLPPGSSVLLDVGNAYASDVRRFVPSSATVVVSVPGPINQIAPSQTIVLSPAQAANHIRETWTAIAGHLTRRGAWTLTLFRDPDN